MNKLINICKNYSGIREELTEAEEATVLDLIRTEFKTLSAEDVAGAFKMNASGKYWKSLEAYQTFSPIYVGKVLQEFKEWKRKQNTIKTIDVSHQIENKVDPEQSQKESFEFIKKSIKENGYKEYLPYDWNGAFKHAERIGLISISNEEKKELFLKMKNKADIEIKNERLNMRPVSSILENGLKPTAIKTECRKSLILDLLNN